MGFLKTAIESGPRNMMYKNDIGLNFKNRKKIKLTHITSFFLMLLT